MNIWHVSQPFGHTGRSSNIFDCVPNHFDENNEFLKVIVFNHFWLRYFNLEEGIYQTSPPTSSFTINQTLLATEWLHDRCAKLATLNIVECRHIMTTGYYKLYSRQSQLPVFYDYTSKYTLIFFIRITFFSWESDAYYVKPSKRESWFLKEEIHYIIAIFV